MCADLDCGPMGVSAGRPNRDMAQQTQTVTSTTSSLVQPWTGCVLHRTHTDATSMHRKRDNSCHRTATLGTVLDVFCTLRPQTLLFV